MSEGGSGLALESLHEHTHGGLRPEWNRGCGGDNALRERGGVDAQFPFLGCAGCADSGKE
jgi:hypothetical protein